MSDISIRAKNISKKFRLYHEKRTSIYEAITGYFSRKQHYETLHVLNDVSFEVKKGEVFGIIGKNGSGKTTLLRILSNIYKPDSGSLEVNGTIIPVLALGLGFHPELTATTNIVQSATLFGFSKKEILERTDDIIHFANLERFSDTKLKNFSSGMQMRLAFATAVQVDPDVLLLDEVIAVGDVNFQEKCKDTIRQFKSKGKSIVIVSHDMTVVKEFCDRVMFLNQGQIGFIGDTKEAIRQYLDFMKTQND